MQVVHAAWGPDRRLHLWAERGDVPVAAAATDGRMPSPSNASDDVPPHPFAATEFVLLATTGDDWPFETGSDVVLTLPTRHGVPVASPTLPIEHGDGQAAIGQGTVEPGRWRVPSAAQDAHGMLRVLLAIPDRGDGGVGASVRFFARAALLAIELVARGRFLPAIEKGGVGAAWRVAPGAADVGRLATLAAAMPHSCLAAQPGIAEVPEGPSRLLEEFLGTLVDVLVSDASAPVHLPPHASPAVRLVLGRSVVRLAANDVDALRAVLERWERASRPSSGAYRTLFRLHEPGRPEVDRGTGGRREATSEELSATLSEEPREELPDEPHAEPLDAPPRADWRLEILLGSRDDPSVVLPAAEVWARPARLRAISGGDPEEALLIDIARASRLYPPLEATLQQAVPDGMQLDTAGAHAFLRDGAPLLADAGYTVLLPAWWRQRRRRLGLRLHVRPRRATPGRTGTEPGIGAQTLVDYDWRLAIGDADLTEKEIASLARLKSGLVWIRGEWVEIEAGEMGAALQAIETQPGGGAQPAMTVADVFRAAAGLSEAPGGLEVSGVEAEGWIRPILGGDEARAEPIPTPPGFGGTLRPYQERGLGWLSFLDRLGFGGILADDMGLGKTPQLLALLVAEKSNVPAPERLGPTLVVCPMSVVGNWQHEAARFAPTLEVHVHHGAGRLDAAALAEAVRDVDLVITTYALAARDRAVLAGIPWRRVVLDEAQEIKNSDTDQSVAVRSFRAPSRFALTGTPVENRLGELWTIMEFCNPGFLGTEAAFANRFSLPIERWRDEGAAERLRRLTSPFILRRVKTDRTIVPELPEKLEFAISCNLTREQATIYQAVVDELLPDLERTTEDQAYRGKVLRAILRLKQVCNHPAQFLGDGSPLHGRSGKLARLEEILDQVLAGGERALVFTQFTEWADRLVPYLRERFGREVLYLHGQTSRKGRDELVERFAGGSVPIFVLSLKAGGKGLNLVAANHVVHYDRWWNPAVEDQASDRAYRIGQTRDVQIRTLVATGTLEDKIADVLTAKRDLAARVVRAGERSFTELSTGELRAVLALSADAVAES